MKALSIRQPWLYCITDLDKRVENRTWAPPDWIIGQCIYLHASKRMDDLIGKRAASELAGFKLSTVVDSMPLGGIVATARVDGWFSKQKMPNHPLFRSKWFFGPIGWILSDIRQLPEFVPHRGQLGLWDV